MLTQEMIVGEQARRTLGRIASGAQVMGVGDQVRVDLFSDVQNFAFTQTPGLTIAQAVTEVNRIIAKAADGGRRVTFRIKPVFPDINIDFDGTAGIGD